MEPVKLGIIGCGLAAANLHWPTLRNMQDRFSLVVVCDSEEKKAKSFSKATGGVPYVLDSQEVLSRSDVEAADIVLPVDLHYSVAKQALEAGKHVFLEKPLAMDLKQAELLVNLANRYPQVKIVGENFRYRRALWRLKEHLEYGMIGQPYAAFCHLMAAFYLADYAKTSWRQQQRFSGGVVTDVGIHYAAQLRLLFGELTVDSAFAQSANPDLGRIDSLSFSFSSAQGLKGVMNLFLGVRDYFSEGILILGADGSLSGGQFGSDFGNFRIALHKNGQVREEIIENDTGLEEEFSDFYQAVRSGGSIKSSFSEAFSDLKLILNAVGLATS